MKQLQLAFGLVVGATVLGSCGTYAGESVERDRLECYNHEDCWVLDPGLMCIHRVCVPFDLEDAGLEDVDIDLCRDHDICDTQHWDDTGTDATEDTTDGPDAASACGDGVIDDGETCDGEALDGQTCDGLGAGSGELGCLDDCSDYDTSGCAVAVCGDGVREGDELCDTLDIDETCEDLGADAGELRCGADCQSYNSSDCRGAVCGDGEVEGDEVCDDGNNLTEVECAYGRGTCEACAADCSEVLALVGPECGDGALDEVEACDIDALDGESCASQGALDGTLLCEGDCSAFDLAECRYAACGDGVREGDEVCDTLDVDRTCQDLGADVGVLRCASDCAGYDSSDCRGAICGDGEVEGDEVCDDGNNVDETACVYGEPTCTGCAADCAAALDLVGPYCGDGMISDGETCDGPALDDRRCQDEGGFAGELSCLGDCSGFDISACEFATCGDGVREGDELCDTFDVERTCEDLGADAGLLRCADDCQRYDASDCRGAVCGDGDIEGDEVCDDGNNVTETACPYGVPTCDGCSETCDATLSLVGPRCGDGVVNGAEVCDGTALNDRTCVDEGGFAGALGCAEDCSSYDASGCELSTCGDGDIEGDELCDRANLGGVTCIDLGADYGDLRCAVDCQSYVTDACSYAVCGNGDHEPTEVCDDGNLTTEACCPYGQATCEACDASCSQVLELTGGACGDGDVNGPEVCDDGNNVTETACSEYGVLDCVACRAGCLESILIEGEYCGDGEVNGPESCDDGDENGSLFRCRADCSGRNDVIGAPSVGAELQGIGVVGHSIVAYWQEVGVGSRTFVYDASGASINLQSVSSEQDRTSVTVAQGPAAVVGWSGRDLEAVLADGTIQTTTPYALVNEISVSTDEIIVSTFDDCFLTRFDFAGVELGRILADDVPGACAGAICASDAFVAWGEGTGTLLLERSSEWSVASQIEECWPQVISDSHFVCQEWGGLTQQLYYWNGSTWSYTTDIDPTTDLAPADTSLRTSTISRGHFVFGSASADAVLAYPLHASEAGAYVRENGLSGHEPGFGTYLAGNDEILVVGGPDYFAVYR